MLNSTKTLVIVENGNRCLSQRFYRVWNSIITFIILFNQNISTKFSLISGRTGGIRTHGDVKHSGFQDQCIQPDSATVP